ncbi:hypothetical protein O7599_25160 [Streptomyces sp. WMMC500]|uniref:hypothetical protein n=1 Tax=Streptomyces sp. WMMC500 TaxID=3015154 RepID=UPI00248CDEC8|nr:hypothetical protein [Streptomyces sp. WMMC500]WBB58881.1 hypothetical protein O7599_25160 [Streptomyces sp. WMMC500]
MATYTIRYAERARAAKDCLSPRQKSSLEVLEKRLAGNPYGFGAQSNRDSSWSAFFTGGVITYVVSNRYLIINVIDVTAV